MAPLRQYAAEFFHGEGRATLFTKKLPKPDNRGPFRGLLDLPTIKREY